MDSQEPGFKITAGKGFYITFQNGYTLSCQFGWGNYASNLADAPLPENFNFSNQLSIGSGGSPDCEIAIWRSYDEGMVELDGDTVSGWVTPEQVADVAYYLSRVPPGRIYDCDKLDMIRGVLRPVIDGEFVAEDEIKALPPA